METPTRRRSGTVRIDPDALMHALGLRGISAYDLAHAAQVHVETVSRIMRGYRVYPRTAGRLMDALIAIPVVAGSKTLLVAPHDGTNGRAAAPRPRVPFRPLRPDEGIPPAEVDGLKVVDVSDKPSRVEAVATGKAPEKQIAAADDSAAAIQGVGHDPGPRSD